MSNFFTNDREIENEPDVSPEDYAVIQRSLEEAHSRISAMGEERQILEENLDQLRLMMDDRGWLPLWGARFDDGEGPDMDLIKKRSEKIREYMIAQPWIKQGAELRSNYVWANDIVYEGLPERSTGVGRRSAASKVLDYIEHPVNQLYVFGSNAHKERERALYSDGHHWLIFNDSTKIARRLSLSDITADFRNPDFDEEIWAYRRTWTRRTQSGDVVETVNRWYFTDIFTDERRPSIRVGNQYETVDQTQTIIDGKVNSQIGWAYGWPDAGAVIEWATIYSEFLKNGLQVTKAMARYIYKITQPTKKAVENTALKVGNNAGGAGQSAVIAGGDIQTLASAGKAYEFSSGLALAAAIATGLQVSVVALTSSPGDAGSSYGAASTLDVPGRLAMQERQRWHVEFDTRILKYLGAEDAHVSFPTLLDEAEALRMIQKLVMAWGTGAFHTDEIRPIMAEAADILLKHDAAPEGILLPNNKDSWQRSDIEPKEDPTAPVTQQGPGQGQSNGGAGDTSAPNNDQRNDTI